MELGMKKGSILKDMIMVAQLLYFAKEIWKIN